jgi:hypothetical protein
MLCTDLPHRFKLTTKKIEHHLRHGSKMRISTFTI